MLTEHARNAAPANAQPPASTTPDRTVASPQAGTRPQRVLGVVAAWASAYLALWRHASTDERGEAIVILPPPDRRRRDSD